MIKSYKFNDYILKRVEDVDLWDNLAREFFGYIVEAAGGDKPEMVEIEFKSKWKDVVGDIYELDVHENIRKFEKTLLGFRRKAAI